MSQLKSNLIANRDAVPQIISNAILGPAPIKEVTGYVSAGAADGIGTLYTMVTVPSNARITSVILQNQALGTGGAVNCGVYQNTMAGGAAVNATLFASAESVVSAQGPTDITNQSGSFGIDLQEQPLWQALGLSSDPGTNYDIALAVSAAGTAAGKVGLKVRFVQ